MAGPLLLLARYASRAAADGTLLEQFAVHRDQEAFAEIVRRHGPEVYRACRQLVGAVDADDAFQATFLVLAARPHVAAVTGSVAGWLIGVARRVAFQVRRAAQRRARHEATAAGRHPQSCSVQEPTDGGALTEEIARLPDVLRAPVVECLLRERSQDAVAAELGCTTRTLRRRLEQARGLLRSRLMRRGISPVVLVSLTTDLGRAAPHPVGLGEQTVVVVLDFLSGKGTRPAVLAKGAIKAMVAQTVYRWVVAAAVALVAVGMGVGRAVDPPVPVAARATAPPVPGEEPKAKPVSPPRFAPVITQADGPSPGAVRALAGEAEFLRGELTELWFGKGTRPGQEWKVTVLGAKAGDPVMPPAANDIRVMYWKGGTEGSSARLEFGGGKMTRAWVDLSGPLESVLDNQLPQEMTRVVLSERFGAALPWWANEGIPLLASSPRRQSQADARCRDGLNQGRAVRLRALFALTAPPRDVEVAGAQGHSVGRFLLLQADAEGKHRHYAALGDFLRQGATNGWDQAAKAVYGFKDAPALEASWIEWMKSRESDLRPAAPSMTAVQPLPPAPPTIPPVNTNGGK